MINLIFSLLICNFILIYFYSLSSILEKLIKNPLTSIDKILLGFALIILFSFYFYFSLNFKPNIILLILLVGSLLIFINLKKYLKNFFFTKENYLLNIIIIIFLLPALIYGEQYYIFRGNYWDSSSYLIAGLLFKDLAFQEIILDNYPTIFKEFNNIDRITTGRPIAQYLLSIFLNLKFSIFYSYYLFKTLITTLIFLSLTQLVNRIFLNNYSNPLIISFIFIFSFWNIYIFEIDALSHYLSIPLLIFSVKILFDLNKSENIKQKYFILVLIISPLFFAYPEIIIVPSIFFFIYLIISFKDMKNEEKKIILFSFIFFVILTLPSLKTNYEYLLLSQVKQATRINDWWGYYGSFIFGKENLVLDKLFVNQLKFNLNNFSISDTLKFIHENHFSQKYYFIYSNLLPSLTGLYNLSPGKIETTYQIIQYSFFLTFLNLYLLRIIIINSTFFLKKNSKSKQIFIYLFSLIFLLNFYFFMNNGYWSIIKFYSYYFPFIFIFFAFNFSKSKINYFYLFLLSIFCFYKFFGFNNGIGRYDSFPSIINPYMKKEINWESLNDNDLSKCKYLSFYKDDYIINTYLNLKFIDKYKPTQNLTSCKITLDKKKLKMINE